jgi:hypothetical protein
MVSRDFIAAVKLAKQRSYQIAHAADMHPSTLSRLIRVPSGLSRVIRASCALRQCLASPLRIALKQRWPSEGLRWLHAYQ